MSKATYISIFCALLIGISGALAQGDGNSFDQTQIITGDRTLSVEKAFKISETPNPIDIPVNVGNIKYQLLPKRPATALTVIPIEPARIKVREPLEQLYKGFVKGGAGTYATPYLEAYYTSGRERDLAYGVHLKHLSSNTSINNVAFSGYSENSMSVWGKKVFKEHSLQSKLGFDRNVFHYYGFDPQDQEIEKEDIRQRFNLLTLENRWKSYYRDSSRVNHDVGFDVYHLGDRFDANELGFKATADFRAYRGANYFTLNSGFDLVNYKAAGISAFEFMNDSLDITTGAIDNSNAILFAVPRILLRAKGLRASIGLGLYGQFDNQARFYAFPDAEVSYALFNNIFIPYLGINGKVNRNSYRSITEQNPFVLSQIGLENSITRFNVFGGVRGSISDHISFNTQVGFNKTDNTPLFVNDTLLSRENRFSVVYDEVSTFTMMGELTYQNNKKWHAGVRAEIYSYSTGVEDEAWHLPAHRISLNAGYNLFNKFEIGAQLAWIGKRQVKSLFEIPGDTPEEAGYWKVELDPYLDLTLSAEYHYSSRLTAFIQAHNLTAARYDIYYRFPAQRAFILGGLKYAF